MESNKRKTYKRSITHVQRFNGERKGSIEDMILDFDGENFDGIRRHRTNRAISSNEDPTSPYIYDAEHTVTTLDKQPPLKQGHPLKLLRIQG